MNVTSVFLIFNVIMKRIMITKKNECFLILILFLFFNLSVSIECSQSYVSRVLIDANWGTEPNEFGLIKGQEIESVGPNTFHVGRKGNVLVFDSINKNIKKYNKKGKLIGTLGDKVYGTNIISDDNEYLYVLDGQMLKIYTSTGGIVESIAISNDIKLNEGYGEGMKMDDFGNIFVKKFNRSFQIGKRDKGKLVKLNEREHLKNEKSGMPNNKKEKWFRIKRENKHKAAIQVMNDNGDILKEISDNISDSFGAVLFLEQDKHGFIYVEIERISEDNYVHLEVRKYDENGNLITVIELDNNYYTTVYKKIDVDNMGNVYQFLTTPKGVQVIKFEQQ
ncbi:MAG TPA: hypothetical protein DCP53_01080 [Elusimicrobia bacterium]|nr:MAG: hypothetical protein A2551_00045 [Elusimicrobia bacterium RIFOXYD2_FULL_34_30]HAM37983.1 hypothetical protein [Elusimicrobiota bacterium]